MRESLLGFAIVLAIGCGCEPIHTTLTVHNAADVSIQVETPEGSRVILPPGHEPQEVIFPRTVLPYRGDVLFQASAIRERSGAITLRCDACFQASVLHLVQDSGTLDYVTPQPPVHAVAVTQDELRIRLDYPYYVPGSRHGPAGPFTAFSYEVSTPRSNVIDVRERRNDLRSVGLVELLLGVPLTVGSVALLDVGGNENNKSGLRDVAFAGGVLLAVPALLLDLFGVSFLCTPSGYDRSLLP